MSFDSPEFNKIDASSFRFAIIAARYNQHLVETLVQNTIKTLIGAGAEAPLTERVPGSAELPYAASVLAENGSFDAIIVIGVVIAGDTNHHNVIADSSAITLQTLSIEKQIPVINGMLVVNTIEQAEARAGETINRGKEFAQAAIEMAQFKNQWKTTKKHP